ncbi:GerAB/ArcD/ProY family transporter [Alkalihalobacterium alkalinitrilicum]|uniref:GerAB/ArcD/ProY family transporter n=1 Tax=Alkalihalobacterium alkalinitrilicum TaxID=427920 RepID=UPI001303B27A|nr:endospore germination permease [Alkalihalobacterium alkalinitrilicum]
MQHKEISAFHVILLFMMSTGLHNHVIIIPSLIEVAGRDAWVAILFAFVTYFFYILIVYFIIRKTKQQNLYVWIKGNYGKPISSIILILIGIYLLTISAVTLKDMILWTNITYLPRTPEIVIALSFLVLCLFMASTTIRTIAIVNGILLPIVILLGFIVMSANFAKKDYSLLTPLFEHGYGPALQGMVYVGSGLVEVFIILCIQHRVKTRINYVALVVIGFLLTWLTIGPTMGAIALFGPEKSGQIRFPAFEQWALLSIGRFVEHVDFLSIFQWLSGGFVRISLALFIIIDLLQVKQDHKKKWLLGIGLFIAAIMLIPISDIQFVELLTNYFLPGLLIYVLCLTGVIGFIGLIQKRSSIEYEK